MIVKRTATIAVVGGALAAWLAGAATSNRSIAPPIVGRDDHAPDRCARLRAAIHVLDHRTTVDVGERLAWESGRSESGGDDSDDLKWGIVIDRLASRYRVHDE